MSRGGCVEWLQASQRPRIEDLWALCNTTPNQLRFTIRRIEMLHLSAAACALTCDIFVKNDFRRETPPTAAVPGSFGLRVLSNHA